MHLRRWAAPLALAWLLATASAAAAAAAAAPTVTITNPLPGQQSQGGVVLEGEYRSDTGVDAVRIVVCRHGGGAVCTEYLQSTADGAMGPMWRSHPAVLSAPGSSSGTYRLELTGLRAADDYRALVFAADATTHKGPRSSVDVVVTDAAGPEPAGAGYITILWGRSEWQAAAGGGCETPLPGARTLEENAQDLAARGLYGVGGVVVTRTADTGHPCWRGFATRSSWADLALLRDTYGWRFVSQGMHYSDMTSMTTDAQRYEESGATLPHFADRGHTDAWGAFSYPNNKQDAAAHAVVTDDFAFGRRYDSARNDRATSTTYPYPMRTLSVNGGRCHDTALPCYDMPVSNARRTTDPAVVARVLNPGADQWGVVQYYRIVTGSFGAIGDTFAWDCTSPDWQDRWTSQPELTCRENLLQALDLRSPDAVVTHPADVARAWGRIPSA